MKGADMSARAVTAQAKEDAAIMAPRTSARCAGDHRFPALAFMEERYATRARAHDDRFDRVACWSSEDELRRAVELGVEALGQR